MSETAIENRRRLTFRVEGPRITQRQFLKGVHDFFRLINAVSDDVTGTSKAFTWIISAGSGSVVLHADAEPAAAEEEKVSQAIDALSSGLDQLEAGGEERPEHFSDTALEAVKDIWSLTSSNGEGINAVSIVSPDRSQRLSAKSVASVELILRPRYSAKGSVQGTLQGISSRRKYQFHIYDRLTNHRTTCFFPVEMKKRVVDAFDARVSAYGIVSYRSDGRPVNITVEDFKIFPTSKDLPSFEDIIGIYEE